MKKAITIIFVVFLTVLTPINGLSSVYGAGSDEWQNSDLSMQAKAFLYYCKSNNVVLEGSALDALTSFTTDTYYKICNQIGINPTELQSEIKNFTSDNLGLRFLFTNTGITAMNRIFSQFLQNNDLSVSQQDVDKKIYSGNRFTDESGHSAMIYVAKSGAPSSSQDLNDLFSQIGTTYRFDESYFTGLYNSGVDTSDTYYIDGKTYYFWFDRGSRYTYIKGNPITGTIARIVNSSHNFDINSNLIIRKDGNNLYLSGLRKEYYNNSVYSISNILLISNNASEINLPEEDVTVKSPFIQNNNYTTNNNQTVNYITINHEGDVNYYYDDDEPGTTPPKPQDPSDDPTWQPVEPVIPPNNPDQGDNTIIDLPDIDIPDLPSLDFSLGDLREKFPFSIPFDIISLLSVLDGEPQAPVIDAHIPFGTWFDWHFEADFSRFDDTAALIRSVEFIGFCIGLIYITIRLVKG